MRGTKLISLLKTFTPEEIISFEKFISSPFFNSVKNHSRLLDELKEFYPNFDDSKMTKEYLYSKLFKGKTYNKQIMWNLTSGFEKLVREFLVQTALGKIKPLKSILIFQEFEDRDIDKPFLKEMDEMEIMMDEYKIEGSYFYYLLMLEEARISYWQKVKGLQNAFAGNLFKAAELSTLDFLMNIYRKIANIAFYKNTYNIEVHDSIFHEIVKNINFRKISEECVKSRSKNAKLIEFFCNLILCILETENDENFLNAKDFLFENYNLFEHDEARNLISVLENFCGDKTRQGDESYRKQLFELNEFRLKHGIVFYENGKFSKTLYIQIAVNGLFLGKIKWVADFIREYTPNLIDEHQKPMRALADGYMNYELKKYDKALESLNRVDFIDTRDKVHVKNLTAKTYYDMGEFDMLLNHIDSSKHFLKNNKSLSPFFRESYGNFYSYLRNLINAKEKNDKVGMKLMVKKITGEKTLIHKNWLLNKANE